MRKKGRRGEREMGRRREKEKKRKGSGRRQ